ncbi:MAG TPA: hypothetical protein VN368_00215 [Candidatus Methylomirabilis sp.]|nr:hypothetical protein [Candidatus Methylomirabilis sp.]
MSEMVYRKNLNLGCGDIYSSGWLRVDIDRDSFARLFYDLNLPYLPFKDKSFSFVMLSCVIAHIKNSEKHIKERKDIVVDGIGIIPYEKCRRHKTEYNKLDLIFLTEDKVRKKKCSEKYNYWIEIHNKRVKFAETGVR